MDKRLAIKGHSTRGSEVIEILEMLGGINHGFYKGDGLNCLYYIDDKNIKGSDYLEADEFIFFTLEEFLEKYPFKVGDKVIYKNLLASDSIYVVKKMVWVNNQIKYVIHNLCCDKYSYTVFIVPAEDLQLHEDKTHIDCPVNNNFNNDSKPGVTVNGEKLIPPKGYIIKTATMDGDNLTVEYVKNKPQYPKTYEECCKVLGYDPNKIMVLSNRKDITHEENEHYHEMYNLYQLLICRDAYWKIAGEEMGLGKSWKPVWGRNQPNNYVLHKVSNTILRATDCVESEILAFPTSEMRDAFFENFKDLIEECKEFL